jgi:PST family polysaccharide transporter
MTDGQRTSDATVTVSVLSAARNGLARRLGRLQKDDLFGTGYSDTLKATSVRGGAVTVAAQFARIVVQTGATMIIARLLSPEDFGLQAEAIAITGIISLFRDGGLNMATVQRPVITHEETSTLFWINVGLGAMLTLITAASAPVVVGVFHEQRLFWITIVSALVFFLNGLCVQHQALLQRTLRFTTIAQIELSSLVVCSVVGVATAWAGFGYWSLVMMTLSTPIVTVAALWFVVGWIPGRPRHIGNVTSSLLFGGTVSSNMLLMYVATNMSPAFFLGRSWGSEAVGLFTRAYQVVNLPMQQLNNAVFNVAFPALSRIQHDQPLLCRSFLKGYSLQLAINTPVTVCAALFAEEVVRVLLGPQWPAAATLLVLLTPAVMSFSLLNPLGWFMVASGRATRSLTMALVLTPIMILGVGLGARHGSEGVAIGFSVAILALTVPLIAWAIHGTGITLRSYFTTVKDPLLAGLVAGLGGWLFRTVAGSTLSAMPLLLAGTAVVLGIYSFILLIVMGQKPIYMDLAKHVIQRRTRQGAVV